MQGAGLVIFLLWIAVSNLVLGFALAIAMGHGPRRLPGLAFSLPAFRLPKLKLKLPSIRRQVNEEMPEVDETEQQPAPSQDQTSESEPEPEPEIAMESDDGIPLAEALAQFQQDLAEVRNDLSDVGSRLDECSASPTVDAVEECVADLKDAGQGMLDLQTESLKAIEDNEGTNATEIRQAAEEQASQIQQRLEAIDQMEIRPESLEEDCERLKKHRNALTATCATIDQSLTEASNPAGDTTATSDSDSSESAKEMHLEQMNASDALDEWWANDPDHQRPLTMVMIDLDHIGKLNDELGKDVVDSILAHVERAIVNADVHGGRASMINPQRFLLLLPNVAVPKLTKEVETLRETIRSMPLEIESEDVEVTASCAIATSHPGDSARALVTRAEAALIEAKQFGGNRTFLNEGEFPTPVVGATAAVPAAT